MANNPTGQKRNFQGPSVGEHPSGPGLPGHPICPAGTIYDHATGACIPLTKKKPTGGPKK